MPVGAGEQRFGLGLYTSPIKPIADKRGDENLLIVRKLGGSGAICINVTSDSRHIYRIDHVVPLSITIVHGNDLPPLVQEEKSNERNTLNSSKAAAI